MSKKNSLFTALFLGSVLSISILLNIFFLLYGARVEIEHQPHWSYTGYTGPDKWAEISPYFETCKSGFHQSPIDIKQTIKADLKAIPINYHNSPLKIINNGHTIQVNYNFGSSITVDNETYDLLQFHFHSPSEHRINGKSFPLEIHFVHRNQSGMLAVLGVFIEPGQHNPALEPIIKVLPTTPKPEILFSQTIINARELLPPLPLSKFYRYFGSLTTPPCSERVRWFVLEQTIQADAQQIANLSKVLSGNARPIQQLNERFLLQSF